MRGTTGAGRGRRQSRSHSAANADAGTVARSRESLSVGLVKDELKHAWHVEYSFHHTTHQIDH